MKIIIEIELRAENNKLLFYFKRGRTKNVCLFAITSWNMVHPLNSDKTLENFWYIKIKIGGWYMNTIFFRRKEIYITLFKCFGKLKIVGTASALIRTVWPVRSKQESSKWSEHSTDLSDGTKCSRFMLVTHVLRLSAFLGKLDTDTWLYSYNEYIPIVLGAINNTKVYKLINGKSWKDLKMD